MIFDLDTLEMLFEEASEEEGAITFEQWANSVGYDSSWTDRQIYEKLPSFLDSYLGSFPINPSWGHGGL